MPDEASGFPADQPADPAAAGAVVYGSTSEQSEHADPGAGHDAAAAAAAGETPAAAPTGPAADAAAAPGDGTEQAAAGPPASAMAPAEPPAADDASEPPAAAEAVSEPPAADDPALVLNIPAEGVQPWLRHALTTLHGLITGKG